ncbi:MAG: pilus assembly PilX N-terminal domain-containing protein [Kiritimatiellia bacterium]
MNKGKEGVALFTVTAMLTLLSLIGSFAYMVIKTDMAISDNYVSATKAYYQAEAGIYYVRNWIEVRLKNKTLEFNPGHNAVNIPPPAGYTFDTVTDIIQMKDTNAYSYVVTGRATSRNGEAKSSVKIVAFRRPLLMTGILGDSKLDFAPQVSVWSYDSSVVPNPVIADSTGDATIGSNFLVEISPGVTLDGVVNIGAAPDGTPAVYSGPADWTLIPYGRMEPDPLGIIGGELASDFAATIAVNNNANAIPPIIGNVIDMGPHDTLTLPAGDYYLESINKSGAKGTINIDTSGGPVRIFLDGVAYFPPQTTFVGALPTEFSILSRSTDEIQFQPQNDFSGFVYAPFANAYIQPQMNGYGVIWSQLTTLKPGGEWFVDINLLKQFLSKELEFTCWKEIRM